MNPLVPTGSDLLLTVLCVLIGLGLLALVVWWAMRGIVRDLRLRRARRASQRPHRG